MSHVRAQIRTAIAAALGALPSTGANVFVNRTRALDAAQLPALVVTVEAEEIDGLISNSHQQRWLTVAVDGFAAASSAVDDVLDQIGLEVEGALAGAGMLGGLIKAPPQLTETRIGIDESINTPMGRIRMLWRMTTTTPPTQPDTVN